jgi:glycosyltransferase involved in cell wall biosynthesis
MEKISIIVTSYNDSHNLENCIKSLTNQDYDRGFIDLEIIIIDSGSTDNSIKILNKYKNKIKIILKPEEFPRLSPAVARNIGVNNAKGNILILTDSDCIFPKSLVKDTINCFHDRKIDCVIGNREPDFGQGFGTFMRRYDFILYSNKFIISEQILINKENIKKGVPLILLSGNNFAIKKELWDRLGGMRDVFKNPAGEDIMLEADIIKNGYNILFCPKNKIIHIHPISLRELFKKNFQRSEATYLLGKHSNGFVNWRNFAKRGHILNMNNFFICTLLIISILLITIFLKISFHVTILLLFAVFFSASIIKLIRINHRLESILNSKEGNYKKDYSLPLSKLFYFDQIHFSMNSLASINFLWCFMKNKYGIVAKKINKRR